MTAASHRRQHWIPSSYLAPWCDPDRASVHEPYVWLFSKDASERSRKAPRNIFWESDFYTHQLPDGERNLNIEHGFGRIESDFCRVRDRKIVAGLPLTADDREALATFAAAMRSRTRPNRDALRQQWKHALTIADDLKKAPSRLTPEQRREHSRLPRLGGEGPSLSIDDVRRLAEHPLQHMLPTMMAEDLEWLCRMNVVIFHTQDEPGFITSDHPCVYFDPQSRRRPPDLRSRSIEVTLPMSPDHLLLLCWEELPTVMRASDALVTDANQLRLAACETQFVVNQPNTRPEWFR